MKYKTYKPSLYPKWSTTPLRQWGFRQSLPISWTILKSDHVEKPVARSSFLSKLWYFSIHHLWLMNLYHKHKRDIKVLVMKEYLLNMNCCYMCLKIATFTYKLYTDITLFKHELMLHVFKGSNFCLQIIHWYDFIQAWTAVTCEILSSDLKFTMLFKSRLPDILVRKKLVHVLKEAVYSWLIYNLQITITSKQ